MITGKSSVHHESRRNVAPRRASGKGDGVPAMQVPPSAVAYAKNSDFQTKLSGSAVIAAIKPRGRSFAVKQLQNAFDLGVQRDMGHGLGVDGKGHPIEIVEMEKTADVVVLVI